MISQGPKDRQWWVQIAVISTLGIAMVVSILVGVVGGYLLDRALGTKVFFWVGLGIGIVAAYRSMWIMYDRYLRDKGPPGPVD